MYFFDVMGGWAEARPTKERMEIQLLIVWTIFSSRFKQHPGNEPALRNLKKLLTYCDDIYVYYKLAYDNQLYDVVTMLLKDSQTGCCLNDLLAN